MRNLLKQTSLDYFIYYLESNKLEIKSEKIKDGYGNPILKSRIFNHNAPQGKIKIGIISHWGGLVSDSFNIENQYLDLNSNNYYFNGLEITNNQESFIHRLSYIDFEEDDGILPLKLTRLNSSIEILIKDKIPNNIGYILFGGNFPSKIYPFKTTYSFDYSCPKFLMFKALSFTKKSGNILKSVIYADNNISQDFEIRAYDFNHKLIASKVVSNVHFKENHITRLSINLFDQQKEVGFKIQFPGDYSKNIITKDY